MANRMPDGTNGDQDEEWHVLPSSGLDRIGGETRADAELHLRARTALVARLRDDPDVRALFARWDAETAFGRAATALGAHFRRVAAEDGCRSVHHLLDAARAADEIEPGRFGRMVRDDGDLVGAYADAFEAFDLVPLYDAAARLVRDGWGLPWPWIALQLVGVWGDTQVFGIWGESVRSRLVVEDRGAPAPALSFATRPGESVSEAWRRCRDEVIGPLLAAAEAAIRPAGKRSAPEVVERYVGWWYRCRIRGESVRSIAGKVDDRRALVKHGIARAEGWLAVATWTFADEGGGPPGNGGAAG